MRCIHYCILDICWHLKQVILLLFEKSLRMFVCKGAVTLCNLFCNLSRNEFILSIRVAWSGMLHCATFLATCLAIVFDVEWNWKLFSNGEFLLVAQQKHCETSCKRDVTLCNGEKMCCSVAAIVAKSRTWFYFVQCFLQQKCCVTLWLRGMLHLAISLATCVATKLRDKLRHKLHSVTAP